MTIDGKKMVTRDFTDVSTNALLDELERRARSGMINDVQTVAKRMVNILEDTDCPREVIEGLRRWLNEPILTALDLERWRRLDGVSSKADHSS